jgi:peptidoglycan hydrolase FlgJ
MIAPLAGFAVTAALGVANAAADAVIDRASGAKGEAGQSRAGTNEARLRETANAFEEMFLEQMLNRVFSEGGDEGMFAEAGPGADVYRSMLVKEYAGLVAKSGGVGISNQIYTELLRMQEG